MYLEVSISIMMVRINFKNLIVCFSIYMNKNCEKNIPNMYLEVSILIIMVIINVKT